MKNWTRSFPLLSSLLILFPAQTGNSCGWFYDDDEISYRPYNQYIIDLPEWAWFYYSAHALDFGDFTDTPFDYNLYSQKEENIRFWSDYYQGKYTEAFISEMVYADPSDLKQLWDDGISKKKSQKWSNPLAQRWQKGEGLNELKYLLFAHEVVPYVQELDWWSNETQDLETMHILQEQAVDLEAQENDPGIRQRYAFQAIRLAHYAGNFDDCLLLFEQLAKNTASVNDLYWWCLSLKAGAHLRKGEFASAAYYNALVFEHSRAKRQYALRDFYIDSDATWQQALSMCRNEQEQKTLWLMAGYKQPNAAPMCMEALLQLDPAAPELELLITREAEQIQREYLPERDFGLQTDAPWLPPATSDRIARLQQILQAGIASGKTDHVAFWQCASAFLYFLSGDEASCDAALAIASKQKGNDERMQWQITALQTLNTLRSVDHMDALVEKKILPGLKQLVKAPDMFGYDAYRLAMYKLFLLNIEDPVRAEICMNQAKYTDPQAIYLDYPVDEMIAFFRDKNLSPMDQFLHDVYSNQLPDLLDMKATVQMHYQQWEAAKATLQEIIDGGGQVMELYADPKEIHYYDCHDCDHMAFEGHYDKMDLCNDILSLEKKVEQTTGEEKAEACHLLGNIYYNISHFGNSWMATSYYLNTTFFDYYSWNGDEHIWPIADDDPNSVFDNTKALFYYDQAAELTRDREFAAYNVFLAAKCEQNMMYISGAPDNVETTLDYRTRFDLLRSDYKDTEVYLDAIDVCKYFAYSVQNY